MLHTNRPPKGDRSEGFSSILLIVIDCWRFSTIFLQNHYFIDFYRCSFKIIVLYMKIEPEWWRISPGYIWEQFPSREPPKRHHFDSQNLRFLIFRPHFWKCRFWLFVPNPLFESQIPQSTLYKMLLGTIRTICVFSKQSSCYGKTLPKKLKLGESYFLRFLYERVNS